MAVTTEVVIGEHLIRDRRVEVTRITWRGRPGVAYDLYDADTGDCLTEEESFGGYPSEEQMGNAVDEYEHARDGAQEQPHATDGDRGGPGLADLGQFLGRRDFYDGQPVPVLRTAPGPENQLARLAAGSAVLWLLAAWRRRARRRDLARQRKDARLAP